MKWKLKYRLRRRMLATVRRYMVLPRFEDQNLVDELMAAVREIMPHGLVETSEPQPPEAAPAVRK